ncbi:hypothetical protein ACFY4K_33635 [Streptomyces leeuwenhoekii]|uniref:hypothetical protein n=1 Tax=Streptomyces leeuwenhoekii TaxID=1437453 RepID=UPI0036D02326
MAEQPIRLYAPNATPAGDYDQAAAVIPAREEGRRVSARRALALPSTRSEEPNDADELEAGIGEEPAAARSSGVVAELTGADLSTPLTVQQLPTPYDVPETVTRPLNDQERGHLAVCEQALHAFRRSVIVAGKALEVINRGRLYRETHGTFVEYLDDVWGFGSRRRTG